MQWLTAWATSPDDAGTKGGVRISSDQVTSALSVAVAQFNDSGGKITAAAGGASSTGGNGTDPTQYLVRHGYARVTSYQPGSRYWPLQWIKFGWLAVTAVVLLALTFWLLRRRPA